MILWQTGSDTRLASAATDCVAPQTAPRPSASYLEPVQLAAKLFDEDTRKDTDWSRPDERSRLGSSTWSHASVSPNVYHEGDTASANVPPVYASDGFSQQEGMPTLPPPSLTMTLSTHAPPVADTPPQTSVEPSPYSDLIGGNGRVILSTMANADVLQQGQQAAQQVSDEMEGANGV
jgi:hypothetical protein